MHKEVTMMLKFEKIKLRDENVGSTKEKTKKKVEEKMRKLKELISQEQMLNNQNKEINSKLGIVEINVESKQNLKRISSLINTPYMVKDNLKEKSETVQNLNKGIGKSSDKIKNSKKIAIGKENSVKNMKEDKVKHNSGGKIGQVLIKQNKDGKLPNINQIKK